MLGMTSCTVYLRIGLIILIILFIGPFSCDCIWTFQEKTSQKLLHIHAHVGFYQRTNGPVNAHLISGPRISTKYTNLEKTRSRNDLDGDLQYSLSFTELVVRPLVAIVS